MVACVVLPLGPACVDINDVRAGDWNAGQFHLHSGPTPIDLTGLTLTAMARVNAQDQGAPVLTADISIVNAANGDFILRWPGDDVETLLLNSPGAVLTKWKGVWDLQADNGVDDPTTMLEGKINARWDVTR